MRKATLDERQALKDMAGALNLPNKHFNFGACALAITSEDEIVSEAGALLNTCHSLCNLMVIAADQFEYLDLKDVQQLRREFSSAHDQLMDAVVDAFRRREHNNRLYLRGCWEPSYEEEPKETGNE